MLTDPLTLSGSSPRSSTATGVSTGRHDEDGGAGHGAAVPSETSMVVPITSSQVLLISMHMSMLSEDAA